MMKKCKYSKRIQLLLDGWMDEKEAARFEKHLRGCSICQSELIEHEEITTAALEIVEQAPETEYWKNFHSRVMNRIHSREVSPYSSEEIEKPVSKRTKLGIFAISFVSIAAVFLIVANFIFNNSMTPVEDINISQVPDEVSEALTNNTESSAPEIAPREDLIEPVSTDETTQSVKEEESETVANQPQIQYASDQSYNTEESFLNFDRESSDYLTGNIILSDFQPSLTENANITPQIPDFDRSIDERMRLRTDLITSGILAYANNPANGTLSGAYPSISQIDITEKSGLTTSWGYLSMPRDTANADEFERYLIEIELVEDK
jgi:hypothetical protein